MWGLNWNVFFYVLPTGVHLGDSRPRRTRWCGLGIRDRAEEKVRCGRLMTVCSPSLASLACGMSPLSDLFPGTHVVFLTFCGDHFNSQCQNPPISPTKSDRGCPPCSDALAALAALGARGRRADVVPQLPPKCASVPPPTGACLSLLARPCPPRRARRQQPLPR